MAILNNNCIATLYKRQIASEMQLKGVCLIELLEGLFQTGFILNQYLNVLCLDFCLVPQFGQVEM